MLKRKAYDSLLEWKQSGGESALLLEGARRTGKTTLAEAFAKNEHSTSLIINFETAAPEVREIFERYRHNIDDFFKYLTAFLGVKLKRRDALVVFDEVQRYPLARSFIKQLVTDGRYDYMEAGSLISIKQNVAGIIIPSEEDRLEFESLDFEEFLVACGDDALLGLIRESRGRLAPLPDELYRSILFDKLNVNEGMLVENAVAQQLRAAGECLYFYSAHDSKCAQNTMEIDFLLVREYDNAALKQRVSPLEVKSSKSYRTVSLDKFKAKFGKRVGNQYVLHPKPLKVEGERVYLPLYMARCLW